jgi:hypothetical protein
LLWCAGSSGLPGYDVNVQLLSLYQLELHVHVVFCRAGDGGVPFRGTRETRVTSHATAAGATAGLRDHERLAGRGLLS